MVNIVLGYASEKILYMHCQIHMHIWSALIILTYVREIKYVTKKEKDARDERDHKLTRVEKYILYISPHIL